MTYSIFENNAAMSYSLPKPTKLSHINIIIAVKPQHNMATGKPLKINLIGCDDINNKGCNFVIAADYIGTPDIVSSSALKEIKEFKFIVPDNVKDVKFDKVTFQPFSPGIPNEVYNIEFIPQAQQ